MSNDSIHFLGFVNSPQELYHETDVYISCSLTEGNPNSVIEALCHGCLCILSDIPLLIWNSAIFSEAVFSINLMITVRSRIL